MCSGLDVGTDADDYSDAAGIRDTISVAVEVVESLRIVATPPSVDLVAGCEHRDQCERESPDRGIGHG